MYLDRWVTASKPINVPIPAKTKVLIGTPDNDYKVLVKSLSADIVSAEVLDTPPKSKHFRKGDCVLFHKDNILKKIE